MAGLLTYSRFMSFPFRPTKQWMQYVMKRRIGEAQNLLADSTVSIGDIADHLGFSSICHLNTMFNKYVGMPPGKYRQSRKNMQE